MPWQVVYHRELRVVDTRYAGILSAEELLAAVEKTLAMGREEGTELFLGDCSALQGGHSILHLYELAELLESRNIPRTVKEALILPEMDARKQEVEFWEVFCRNRGYNVRIFTERDKALEWLCKNAIEPVTMG
jgi:hypothetical protein